MPILSDLVRRFQGQAAAQAARERVEFFETLPGEGGSVIGPRGPATALPWNAEPDSSQLLLPQSEDPEIWEMILRMAQDARSQGEPVPTISVPWSIIRGGIRPPGVLGTIQDMEIEIAQDPTDRPYVIDSPYRWCCCGRR